MSLGNRFAVQAAAQVPDVRKPRSTFDRSRKHYTSMNFDEVTPIFFDEVLPGDTYNVNASVFARLATQIAPAMDNLYIDYFYFFIPNRLVWENWERFMGAQDNPTDSVDYILPKTTLFTPVAGGFYDRMGIRQGQDIVINNNLAWRAYRLVFNQWFRDQNLQDSLTVPLTDGPDNVIALQGLYKRRRRQDKFGGGLPWPQKGPATPIPQAVNPPVKGIMTPNAVNFAIGPSAAGRESGETTTQTYSPYFDIGGQSTYIEGISGAGAASYPNIRADMMDAETLPTINDLREAWMIQTMFEIDAIHGTRYVEILYGQYGVISPDFRLQRSEYLGGGQGRINPHPVPQTSETGSTDQATLTSFATSQSGPRDRIGFNKSFVEHGMILGFAAARADITYQQGIAHKFFDKTEKYDFYFPALANLGEQPILLKEIYLQDDSVIDPVQGIPENETVFCYQEPWADYKYATSYVSGDMNSDFTTPLDQWHFADHYSTKPEFNDEWIESNTPIERNIAVDPAGFSSAVLIMDIWHDVKCSRLMPVRSIPARIGGF